MDSRINKRRENKILLSVLLIIFLTDSLLFATSNIEVLNTIKRIIPVVVAVIFVFINITEVVPGIILVCISIVMSMVYVGRVFDGYSYITQIALLISAYYYAKYVSFEEFKECFIKWMRIIAIVSLIVFLLGDIIKTISFLPTIENANNYSYKTLFLTNIPISNSFSRRNWGPFWEPGTYQCYLNVALLFSVFSKYKFKTFDMVLFVITALTTMSGAAILPMPFIVLAYVFTSNQKGGEGKIAIVVFMCISIFIALESGVFDEVIYKVTGGVSSDNNSIAFRLGSMIANIKAALKYPLFGASPEIQDQIRAEVMTTLIGAGYTGNVNTLFAFFSYYGIPVGCFYTARIIIFTKNFSLNPISRIFVFLAIFFATSNENLMASSMINILLFISSEHTLLSKEGKKQNDFKRFI